MSSTQVPGVPGPIDLEQLAADVRALMSGERSAQDGPQWRRLQADVDAIAGTALDDFVDPYWRTIRANV